jgi:5-(carboxyamino)imidazole ribonucleotide synthase
MTQPKRYPPGATIGVMGGGQLGRMLASAARRMGYRIHIFTPELDSPGGQLADFATVARYDDADAVNTFASAIDLLTFEFENIPSQTVEWCAPHCEIRPAGRILHIAQNRIREKEFLRAAAVPIAPFRRISSAQDLRDAAEKIGTPAILKTAAFGYDGKGQRLISGGEDFESAWRERGGEESVLEAAVEFAKEISVIVARGVDGNMKTFPVSENLHRDHILDVTVVPAELSDHVGAEAADLAKKIAEKLELVGLLAVEMFLKKDGALIVNELAPRPHNSGHWSIEGCATSQFEQQLRAVCGLPLGSTELLRPTAMANLLGDVWRNGEPDWSAALAVPNVHLHLYGKREPRARRKMGHLTAVAASADEAPALVRRARESLTLA